MDKPVWEKKTDEAYARYVSAIKADLGPEANFQEMEQAILKHSRELLRTNLESLASDEAFSPCAKSSS